MTMKSIVKRLMRRQHSINRKLRKAVTQGKPRQVALLLDDGANPTWSEEVGEAEEMNALLLACKCGDVEILNLLIDWFFNSPDVLAAWGRHMYCVIIRNGHWKAFLRLAQRNVPMGAVASSTSSLSSSQSSLSSRSRLPAPAFVAAERGQSHILRYLISQNPRELTGYSFNGHSLLSIATKYGHYDCVEVLLSQIMVTDDVLDFAVEIARQHRQAHVLVLLTSCQPQFLSSTEPLVLSSSSPSVSSSGSSSCGRTSHGSRSSLHKPRRSSQHNRGSLAETDILSDYGGDQDNERPRRSSTWLYPSEKDLTVYHPYLDHDEESETAEDEEAARKYEAYVRGLDELEEQDWTTTPPVSESVSRAIAMAAAGSDSGPLTTPSQPIVTKRTRAENKPTWYYRNEVILPYEEDAEVETKVDEPAPLSDKPQLPPPSNDSMSRHSLFVSPMVTQISRKIVSIRSRSMKEYRA